MDGLWDGTCEVMSEERRGDGASGAGPFVLLCTEGWNNDAALRSVYLDFREGERILSKPSLFAGRGGTAEAVDTV